MWIILGFGAVITAILNILCVIKHREAKWFRFISLSLTALTLCDFYSQVAKWALVEDWSAIMDVVPNLAKPLLLLTILSILLNSISLLGKKK